MIFHVSIDADQPQQVAEALAELWGGIATPFPPVIEGSWIAMAGDARNSGVEVYPRGTKLVAADGDADAYGVIDAPDRRSATHIAIATDLTVDAVRAIAARHGWPIKYRKRGDAFGVLELWIEGVRMIEVLTPEMQAEYLDNLSVAKWQQMLVSMGMAEAA